MKSFAFAILLAMLYISCEQENYLSSSNLEGSNLIGNYAGSSIDMSPNDFVLDSVTVFDTVTNAVSISVVERYVDDTPPDIAERVDIMGERVSKTPNDNGGHNYYCTKNDAVKCYSSYGTVIREYTP